MTSEKPDDDYRSEFTPIEDSPLVVNGAGHVAVGTPIGGTAYGRDWRGEVTESLDGEWSAILHRVPTDADRA